jgi:RNA polymerase sigma-70 factor (ECF subfamily)
MGTPRTVLHPVWQLRARQEGEGAAARARTDEELIRAVLRGDDRVTAELYRSLFPTVDRTLCRVFGGRDREHEDMVQNAFEQIVSTIASSKFNRACSLATWASAVTTKVGLSALRSRYRERNLVDRSGRVDSTKLANLSSYEIDRQLGARDMIQKLQMVLSNMSPHRAEVLFLHDVAGLELSEIGALIGDSEAAVQSRLVRGRRELLARLSELDESGGALS